MKAKNTYRIVVTCDPYNAKFHYNGQEVLEYNGKTPVKWVEDFCDGLTLDEAREKLMELAQRCPGYTDGNWTYEDAPEDPDGSWFKGAGIYDRDGRKPLLVLLDGGDSFDYDVLSYTIEEEEN